MANGEIAVLDVRYNPDSILTQILILALRMSQRLTCLQLSVFTLFVINMIATFNAEVEHIWKAKQSKVTIVFYIVRYLPPICTGLSILCGQSYDIKYWDGACKIWFWMEGMVCMVAVQVMAEFLMVIRVWALYGFSRQMILFLSLILIGRFGIGLWGGVMLLPSISFAKLPREVLPIPGCAMIPSADTLKYLYLFKITCIYNIFATGIVFICLLKQCLARNPLEKRFLGTWRDLIGIQSARPLIHVLIRDGNAYFLVILCAELVLLIASSGKDPFVALCVLPFIQAAYAIPATRFVLNLRHSFFIRNQNEIVVDNLTAIEFTPRHALEPEYITQHMNTTIA